MEWTSRKRELGRVSGKQQNISPLEREVCVERKTERERESLSAT